MTPAHVVSTKVEAAYRRGDLFEGAASSPKHGQAMSADAFARWAGARARRTLALRPELMALLGWTTEKVATHDTRAADQQKPARQASEKMPPARMQNDKEDRSLKMDGAQERIVATPAGYH